MCVHVCVCVCACVLVCVCVCCESVCVLSCTDINYILCKNVSCKQKTLYVIIIFIANLLQLVQLLMMCHNNHLDYKQYNDMYQHHLVLCY